MTEKSLLITARALDLDQDWVMRLHVACELQAVEYTRELGVDVTYTLSDRMEQHKDLTIDATSVTDKMVMEAVAAWEPTPTVEAVAALSETVARLEQQVSTLTADVGALTVGDAGDKLTRN